MAEVAAAVEIREYPAPETGHRHDYVQIIVPLRGSMHITIEDQDSVIAGDQTAVVLDGRQHDFEATARGRFLVVDLPAAHAARDRLKSLISGTGRPILWVPRLWRRVFLVAADEIDRDPEVAGECAGLVLQGLEFTGVPRSRFRKGGSSLQLDVVMARMHAEGRGVGNLADLARNAGMSESQFYSAFKQQAGISPKRYQLRVVLERAAADLADTALPIYLVAYNAGYDNPVSFIRVFKRHFGMTPSAYRAAHHQTSKGAETPKR